MDKAIIVLGQPWYHAMAVTKNNGHKMSFIAIVYYCHVCDHDDRMVQGQLQRICIMLDVANHSHHKMYKLAYEWMPFIRMIAYTVICTGMRNDRVKKKKKS